MSGPNLAQPQVDGGGHLIIVIPAFDEAATIASLVGRAVTVADEVIVIDDGSRDDTGRLAAEAGALVVRNATNLGKGAALKCGIAAALARNARYIVTLDGDGQHCPEDAGRLRACAQRFPDHIVIGSRRADKASAPRQRYIANRVADFWISWAAGYPIEDTQSGFRLYPRELFSRMAVENLHAQGFALEAELLIVAGQLGFRTVSVDIDALYAQVLQRPSHFRPVADIVTIGSAVGGQLLRQRMNPAGLWRVLAGGREPAHWP